jgi:DNA (cytosine-5)-methyltransferase 1
VKAVDLFAGWGGFTLGATQAGASVVYAANHWPLAVQVHAANHPTTHHECQDLRQADWSALPEFDLLLASPACQGHSQAAQPKRVGATRRAHDALRATAWAVVDCVEVTRPRAIIVENVVDFRRWDKFDLWLEALRRDGYSLQQHIITATSHRVPQQRQRLFVVGTRNGRALPLRLPRLLSGAPEFAPCIEPNATGWRPIAGCPFPRARTSLQAAASKYGRALVQYTTGHTGISLREPIRTITTKDQWRLVEGDQYRPLTLREYARGMGFPDSYTWPDGLSRSDVVKGLGNAVCPPVARDVVRAVMEVA